MSSGIEATATPNEDVDGVWRCGGRRDPKPYAASRRSRRRPRTGLLPTNATSIRNVDVGRVECSWPLLSIVFVASVVERSWTFSRHAPSAAVLCSSASSSVLLSPAAETHLQSSDVIPSTSSIKVYFLLPPAHSRILRRACPEAFTLDVRHDPLSSSSSFVCPFPLFSHHPD
jgi:hypothetical protein